MNSIILYRKGVLLHTIKISDAANQNKEIMGINSVGLSFQVNHYLDIQINDYATIFGERYTVAKHPLVNKLGSNLFEFTLVLEGEESGLIKANYLFLGTTNTLREPRFSVTGKARVFLDLIVANMNRLDPGWAIGGVLTTAIKTISFNNQNCHNALAKIATEFDTEFFIENKTIHLVKKTNDTALLFKHGKHRGLYELNRVNISEAGVITRLYAFGAEKNLPPTYGSDRLRLPNGYDSCLVSGVGLLVTRTDIDNTYDFSWTAPTSPDVTSVTIIAYPVLAGPGGPGVPEMLTDLPVGGPATWVLSSIYDYTFQIMSHGGSCVNHTTPRFAGNTTPAPLFVPTFSPYVEKNVSVYGIIEGVKNFDDIFPQRTGLISSIDITDIFKVIDTSLDFNINDQLLPGLIAKITFNTGELTGYTFNILEYDHATKTIVFSKNNTETALDIPNNLMKPGIGDEYVLTDIKMPNSYIVEAEDKLLAKAIETIDVYGEPQVSYQLVLDPLFIKQKEIKLKLGDRVRVVDSDYNIDRKIRVIGITRNLVQENQYELKLGDLVEATTFSKIIEDISGTSRVLGEVEREIERRDILNGRVLGTLRFDGIPTTATEVGFKHIVISDSDGKLYKKI